MSAQKGALMLLKAGNGAGSETFTTVGGLRTTRFTLNQQVVDTTNKDSGSWRQLLSGAGIRSISITGVGVFTDSAAEATVRGYAFAGTVHNYQLCFGNGDVLSGAFQITAYERSGDYNGEESYSLTMESAGIISYT